MTRQDKEDFNEIGNDESDNVLIEEAGVDRGVNDPRIMFLMNLFFQVCLFHTNISLSFLKGALVT